MQRVARAVQPPQADGADHQADATDRAQQLGQRRQVVRRRPAEQVVVERAHAGGGKAQQKAVEREVVHAPAAQRVFVVCVVAAVAVAAVEILQAQHVVRGLGRRAAAGRRAAGGGLHLAQEAAHPHAQRQHREPEHRREQADQQVVRKDGVEVATQPRAPDRPPGHHRQHQEQRQAQCQRHRQHEPVGLVQAPQPRRPGVVGIGLAAHRGHGLRHVHHELVRRRVLAGVQAGTAVVAQVGQVVHVGLGELQPARHGRKHGAEAFAVAAGVADGELARDLGLGGRHRHHLAVGQGARVACEGFKRGHAMLLDSWLPAPHWRRQCGQTPCR